MQQSDFNNLKSDACECATVTSKANSTRNIPAISNDIIKLVHQTLKDDTYRKSNLIIFRIPETYNNASDICSLGIVYKLSHIQTCTISA